MVDLKNIEHELNIRIVTNNEDMTVVWLLRALCFMQQGLSKEQAIDGNDFQATHILITHGKEPVATARLRWFAGFAKMERTCFREEYRSARLMLNVSSFVFDHIARKGYARLITQAEPKLAKMWQRLLGFEVVPQRDPLVYPNVSEECIELVKHLNVPNNVISEASTPLMLARVEGHWETPHALEA